MERPRARRRVAEMTDENGRRRVESRESRRCRDGCRRNAEERREDGYLAAVVLVGGIPDGVSTLQTREHGARVAALDDFPETTFAPMTHRPLDHRVLVVAVDDVEVDRS